MAKITKTKSGVIRVVCDCGKFVHELSKGDNDQIECDTYERNEPAPAPPPAPPQETPKQKSRSLFD